MGSADLEPARPVRFQIPDGNAGHAISDCIDASIGAERQETTLEVPRGVISIVLVSY